MLPIQLYSRRFPNGFQLSDDGVLTADPEDREPLIISAPNLEKPLFLALANCKTDDDYRKFADAYFDEPSVTLRSLRDLGLGAHIVTKVVTATERSAPLAGDPALINALLVQVRLRPRIQRIDGVPRLILEVNSVRDFISVEIAAAYEVGAKVMACQHCSKLILYGPLTGRRSHAKFCGDKCRVAAMRTRNAAKEAAK
jgi:hypothetical protein